MFQALESCFAGCDFMHDGHPDNIVWSEDSHSFLDAMMKPTGQLEQKYFCSFQRRPVKSKTKAEIGTQVDVALTIDPDCAKFHVIQTGPGETSSQGDILLSQPITAIRLVEFAGDSDKIFYLTFSDITCYKFTCRSDTHCEQLGAELTEIDRCVREWRQDPRPPNKNNFRYQVGDRLHFQGAWFEKIGPAFNVELDERIRIGIVMRQNQQTYSIKFALPQAKGPGSPGAPAPKKPAPGSGVGETFDIPAKTVKGNGVDTSVFIRYVVPE